MLSAWLRGPTGNVKAAGPAQLLRWATLWMGLCKRASEQLLIQLSSHPCCLRRTPLYKLSWQTHNNPRLREEPEAMQEPGRVTGQGSNSAASSPLLLQEAEAEGKRGF